MKDALQLPFVQVALPIVITFAFAIFYQNKRMDDLKDLINHRLDGIDQQLAEIRGILRDIQKTLDSHSNRITALEERTSVVRR